MRVEGESWDEYIARFRKEREEAGQIKCPFCGAIYNDEDYTHVSYHGCEDGPREQECPACDEIFWVEESVTRTYSTSKES